MNNTIKKQAVNWIMEFWHLYYGNITMNRASNKEVLSIFNNSCGE